MRFLMKSILLLGRVIFSVLIRALKLSVFLRDLSSLMPPPGPGRLGPESPTRRPVRARPGALPQQADVSPQQADVSPQQADVSPQQADVSRLQSDLWGWFPATALISAVMLGLVSLADGLSRSGHLYGELPFWIGVTVPIGVVAFRQASPAVPRGERIILVVLAGMFLYLVKVLYDPFGFMFADEFIQVYNTNSVLHTHSLFVSNPILDVSPYYPGLPSLTAAVASLTHLTVFGAGLVVIGTARVVMILAVYLLVERATASPRVAALSVLIYASAPNFLFFTAQFSYESLALPIAAVAVYAVASWSADHSRNRTAWAITALLLIAAVVPSHHLTSYALVCFLLALSVTHWVTGNSWKRSPLTFACFALALIVTWLVFVASVTVGYLQPIFTSALNSTITTIAHEGAGARKAFEPAPSGPGIPAARWDRGLAITSTALIILLLPVGLYAVWQRYRRNAVILVLAFAASAYIGSLPLRLVPQAWEIANRASEFLFLGVAVALALAWTRRPATIGRYGGRLAVALLAMVIFAGGVAAGWRPELRLTQPLRVKVGSSFIEPQNVTAARWTRRWLPTGRCSVLAANDADARLLATYGGHLVGKVAAVTNVIDLPGLEPWQMVILRDESVRYAFMNRRVISKDNIAGYFFTTKISPPAWNIRAPAVIYRKFDNSTTSRIFDSGDVIIYDVARLVRERTGFQCGRRDNGR